jgi:DNA-binding HxlR family transcriptional regulator
MEDAPTPAGKTPLPGSPVRGSTTGRPIMAAFDLLGRRWTLRILWELRDGAVGFRALQQRCGDVSPTVLNSRLGELRSAGLVERDPSRAHHLTPLGQDLHQALTPLQDWSERWAESRPDAHP